MLLHFKSNKPINLYFCSCRHIFFSHGFLQSYFVLPIVGWWVSTDDRV